MRCVKSGLGGFARLIRCSCHGWCRIFFGKVVRHRRCIGLFSTLGLRCALNQSRHRSRTAATCCTVVFDRGYFIRIRLALLPDLFQILLQPVLNGIIDKAALGSQLAAAALQTTVLTQRPVYLCRRKMLLYQFQVIGVEKHLDILSADWQTLDGFSTTLNIMAGSWLIAWLIRWRAIWIDISTSVFSSS